MRPPVTLVPAIDRSAQADLWQKGLSLGEAGWQFAPPELKQRFSKARDLPDLKQFNDKAGKQDLPSKERWALPNEFIKIVFEPSNLKREMHKLMLEALKAGSFIAYGEKAPPQLNQAPRLIPREYFSSCKIDWDASAINISGTTIIAIKVFKRKLVELSSKELPQLPKKMGRPTRKSEIIASFNAVRTDCRTNSDVLSKVLLDSIRNHVIANAQPQAGKKPDWGLSDQVIKREIKAYLAIQARRSKL